MLIRFIVQNIFSFGEMVEFDMLRYPKIRKHTNHCTTDSFPSVLKFGAIYGANGAGKSNLIKAMKLLQRLVYPPAPIELSKHRNKFAPHTLPQILGIEFRSKGKNYYYEIESIGDIILNERLSYQKANKTSLGEEIELFSRTQIEGKTSLKLRELQHLETSIASLLRPSEPLLAFAYERLHGDAPDIICATDWMRRSLVIIDANIASEAILLPLLLNNSVDFREEVNSAIGSLDTGVENIDITRAEIPQDSEIYKHLQSNASWLMFNETKYAIYNRDIFISESDEKIYKLREDIFHHDQNIAFKKEEESDGTIKLMQMMPFFLLIQSAESTLVIDEVERSIHPLLIKKLLEIWAKDSIKGQLVFTTHESLLLDFDIFRKDEIWFTEKNGNGITGLYPLNNFITSKKQERDIAKVYLHGRLGAIPSLSQLVSHLKR